MKRQDEISRELRGADTWDMDLCKELCELAGLAEKWENADGDSFESIVYEAAEKLGVEVL